MSVLRLMRIFRIVRIFNKLENMKKILNANVAAFGPVLNAFLLFGVVLSIFSVIAVNLFFDTPGNLQGSFESFTSAFITLLGITTGEEWSTYVRAGTGDGEGGGDVNVTAAIYFLTYIVLVSIMAFNIIIAVLLEGFVSSMTHADTSKRILEEAREHHKVAGPLDPLLATLANFNSPQHLKSQLDLLFCLWDIDDGGSISYNEMLDGLQNLGYHPCISLSTEDWESFTHHGLLLNEEEEMDQAQAPEHKMAFLAAVMRAYNVERT